MGWSLFPVAYLPGQSSYEVSMTSQQFDTSLFELANGMTFTEDTLTLPTTGNYDVTDHKVTLKTDTSVIDTIVIDGLTKAEGTTAEAGSFVAEETAPTDGETKYTTVITIADNISSLNVTYFRPVTVSGGGVDNRTTAIGEMTMVWPVYGSGDEENAVRGADIKGYIVEIIYRARITQAAGFSNSYKNVAGNQITVGAMDPHRADERVYYVGYYAA